MKKEDLFNVIGDIDDKYIDEARQVNMQKKHSVWMKSGILAASIFICATAAFAIHLFKSDNLSTDSSENNRDVADSILDSQKYEDDYSKTANSPTLHRKLQETIRELQSSDSLGWIVIDNKVYLQVGDMNGVELETNEYLGKASEYTGFYQSDDNCDGEVYTVENQPNLIYIKLSNGGSVALRIEDN